MAGEISLEARAAVILDDAIRREGDAAPASDLVGALTYRAELVVRTGDPAAAAFIAQARAVELALSERGRLGETLRSLDDLEALAASTPSTASMH